MPDYESLAGCPFLNDKMADMVASAELFKRRFCKGDFQILRAFYG